MKIVQLVLKVVTVAILPPLPLVDTSSIALAIALGFLSLSLLPNPDLPPQLKSLSSEDLDFESVK